MADKDNAAVEKKTTGATQKILDEIKDLRIQIAEMDKSTKVLLTVIQTTLVEQGTTLTAMEKTKSSSRARTTAPAQTPTGKRKFNNKMLFVKSMWVECRDEWVQKYFTEAYDMEGELEKMEQEMQNDKNKKKTGDAKAKAEAGYFWNTYLKGKNINKKLQEAINKAYEEYNNSVDSELGTNKTADVEQEESEEAVPAVASEEDGSAEGDDEPAGSDDEEEKPAKGKKASAPKNEPVKKEPVKKVPSAKAAKVVRKAPTKK